MIKGSCDFIEQSSLYVTILSGLVAIYIYIYCDRRDIFLIYHVTLPGHGSNVLSDFMGGPGLQKLCTYRAVKTSIRCKKKRAPQINSYVCFIRIL